MKRPDFKFQIRNYNYQSGDPVRFWPLRSLTASPNDLNVRSDHKWKVCGTGDVKFGLQRRSISTRMELCRTFDCQKAY